MYAIKSPVTQNEHVSLVAQFPTERIIQSYRQHGISVERFFENIPTVDLYECRDTGYRFYYPSTIFGDGAFYADLQQGGEDYYPHKKWEHQFAARQVRATDKVLEVGAGDGFFLQLLQQQGVKNSVGLELNDNAIGVGTARGLDLRNELVQDHAAQNTGVYDVVCCFQVLEHIYDIHAFLQACLRALKKGGKLIIGVPNNNPYLFRYDKWHTLNLPPHHAGLWSKGAFEQLQKFYEMVPERIIVEPLQHAPDQYKWWYLVQRDYYLEHRPALGRLLSAIPRPLYKLAVKLLAPFIDGRNIVAMFKRT